jgi:hypothetical protein
MTDLERLFGAAALWVAPATVVGAVAVGLSIGLGPAFLVLAGGMLLGAVMLLWSSLGRLTGESPLTLDEAIGLAAPSAEEERKRAVVRALKDLDYERSVGKISEEDYAELAGRYRAEAKALLRALDTGLAPLRKTAEKRLVARLKAEGIAVEPRGAAPSAEGQAAASDAGEPEPAAASTPPPSESAVDSEADGRPADAAVDAAPAELSRPCAKCGTTNDADASFCKRCGARLSAEGAS